MDRWTVEIIEGVKAAGVEPESGLKLERWVGDAGFTNIRHKLLPISVGICL